MNDFNNWFKDYKANGGSVSGAPKSAYEYAIQSLEVTPHLAYVACKAGRITRDEPSEGELARMIYTLNAFLSALKEQAK